MVVALGAPPGLVGPKISLLAGILDAHGTGWEAVGVAVVALVAYLGRVVLRVALWGISGPSHVHGMGLEVTGLRWACLGCTIASSTLGRPLEAPPALSIMPVGQDGRPRGGKYRSRVPPWPRWPRGGRTRHRRPSPRPWNGVGGYGVEVVALGPPLGHLGFEGSM